jgi:hypothetical protein
MHKAGIVMMQDDIASWCKWFSPKDFRRKLVSQDENVPQDPNDERPRQQ